MLQPDAGWSESAPLWHVPDNVPLIASSVTASPPFMQAECLRCKAFPASLRQVPAAALAAFSLAMLCGLPSAGARDGLPPGVKRILAHYSIPQGSYSVWAQDVRGQEPLLAHGADIPRKPASVIKVLTGWLVLEALGPEYRWATRAHLGGELRGGVLSGPLILEGRGDPRLVMERLWLFQHRMRQKGLRAIKGGLVIDDSWLPANDLPVSGFEADRHRAFSASPYALLMNFQSVRAVVEPDRLENRVRARLEPPLTGLELINRVRLTGGRCGGFQKGVAIRITGVGDHRVELDGSYSRNCGAYSIPRRALSGPAYAFGLFDALWREGGGELEGGYRLGSAPDDAEPWLEFASEFAYQAVRFMNKHSNNVMARQLLLSLGAEMRGPPATPEKARAAAIEVLRRAGLDLPSLVLDNGSGLSRTARISAADLGRVLVHAARSPLYPELIASLPVAGRDGTLTRTYRNAPFSGRAHLKTGSLDGVSAIAGIVRSGSGRELAVVALMEHPLAAKGPGEEAHGALLTSMSGR